MPRIPKKACPCGCGQATAATTRNRKCACAGCGYTVRASREMLALGLPVCPCGGLLEPVCLEDRCHVPGQYGVDAWAQYAYRHGPPCPILAERSRRAAQTRKFRAACAAVPDMPF